MTVTDRVLATIATRRSLGIQELRAELHDGSNAVVANVVSGLCREGLLERIGHGRYCLAEPKEPAPRAMPAWTSDFVRAPSMARLMAGR